MWRATIAFLLATTLAGCSCTCDGCRCDGVTSFVYPERDALTTSATAYLQARAEVVSVVGPVQSIAREEALGLPTIAAGTVAGVEARRIRMIVVGATGSASVDVVLVLQAGAWVAVGGSIVGAGALAIGIGDPVTFEERASEGWDD